MPNRIRLYLWELMSMPEYSTSIPTGTTPFKMWRRDDGLRLRHVLAERYRHAKLADNESECAALKAEFEALPEHTWRVGQYYPVEDPKVIGIRWYDVQPLEGPAPKSYCPPDWSNFERYKRERDVLPRL